MTTFLASELAERIGLPGESPVRVLNRVRNWTKLGLLKPIGDRPSGGGRAFLYSDDALLDATVLQLFHAAGIPDTDATRALVDVREKLAERRWRDHLLVVSRPHDFGTWEVGVQPPEKVGAWINRQPKRAFVVVSIRRLLESVGRDK